VGGNMKRVDRISIILLVVYTIALVQWVLIMINFEDFVLWKFIVAVGSTLFSVWLGNVLEDK
jgi:hypothetical protein